MMQRRSFLTGLGTGLITIGGMATPALARETDHDTLAATPGNFAIYAAAITEDGPPQFGFPDHPFVLGFNPGGDDALFGGSSIRVSPNQRTLHNEFQIFGGLVMGESSKPYTLVNQGEGVFEASGQVANFTALPSETIWDASEALCQLIVDGVPCEQARGLLADLGGQRWRAVGRERIHVNLDSAPYEAVWSVTRVDLYTREFGRLRPALSLLYVLWALDAEQWGQVVEGEIPDIRQNEFFPENEAQHLIDQGIATPGGQPRGRNR